MFQCSRPQLIFIFSNYYESSLHNVITKYIHYFSPPIEEGLNVAEEFRYRLKEIINRFRRISMSAERYSAKKGYTVWTWL